MRFFNTIFKFSKERYRKQNTQTPILFLNHDVFICTFCWIRWCCGSIQSYQRSGTNNSSGNNWSSFMIKLKLCFSQEEKITAYIGLSMERAGRNFGPALDMFNSSLFFKQQRSCLHLPLQPCPLHFLFQVQTAPLDLPLTDNSCNNFDYRGF